MQPVSAPPAYVQTKRPVRVPLNLEARLAYLEKTVEQCRVRIGIAMMFLAAIATLAIIAGIFAKVNGVV